MVTTTAQLRAAEKAYQVLDADHRDQLPRHEIDPDEARAELNAMAATLDTMALIDDDKTTFRQAAALAGIATPLRRQLATVRRYLENYRATTALRIARRQTTRTIAVEHLVAVRAIETTILRLIEEAACAPTYNLGRDADRHDDDAGADDAGESPPEQ